MHLQTIYQSDSKKEFNRCYQRDYQYGIIKRIRKHLDEITSMKELDESIIFNKQDIKYINKINKIGFEYN